MSKGKRLLVVANIAVLAFVLGVTATVLAGENGPIPGTGTNINRVKVLASNSGFTADEPSGEELPGARHRLQLTQTTLVVARLSMIAQCVGTDGFCGASIEILDNNNSDFGLGFMQPASGGVFYTRAAPDGGDDDLDTLERSVTLPAGDYDFQVHLDTQNLNGGVAYIVDTWHFTVERIV